MQSSLQDRIALVTGGSRGLGRAMAGAFAAAGADVIIASRKLDSCERAAEEIAAEHGRAAMPIACNVSDWADCDRLIEAAYDKFGRVDILVNNAGLSPLYPSIDQVTEELFDKVIGVNLKGPYRLSSVIGTRMAEDAGGSIINISSVAAIRPTGRALPYAAAKAGLNALTEGLAQELGPKVRVNTIMAGPFDTDVARHWSQEQRQRSAEATAVGRLGRPEDVVGAALYFASDDSSFCTGATLRLDGGRS